MNFKHGFHSKNLDINPDNRLMGGHELSTDQLVIVERFLHGESPKDPVVAHELTKAVYNAGRRKYPTLWDKARKYCEDGYEYDTLEKLSQL